MFSDFRYCHFLILSSLLFLRSLLSDQRKCENPNVRNSEVQRINECQAWSFLFRFCSHRWIISDFCFGLIFVLLIYYISFDIMSSSNTSSLSSLPSSSSRRSSVSTPTPSILEPKPQETPNTVVSPPPSKSAPSALDLLTAVVVKQGEKQDQLTAQLSSLLNHFASQTLTASPPHPDPLTLSSMPTLTAKQAARSTAIGGHMELVKQDVLGANEEALAQARAFLSDEVSAKTEHTESQTLFGNASSLLPMSGSPPAPTAHGLSASLFPTDTLNEGKSLLTILSETLSSKSTSATSKSKFTDYSAFQSTLKVEFVRLVKAIRDATGPSQVTAACDKLEQWHAYTMMLAKVWEEYGQAAANHYHTSLFTKMQRGEHVLFRPDGHFNTESFLELNVLFTRRVKSKPNNGSTPATSAGRRAGVGQKAGGNKYCATHGQCNHVTAECRAKKEGNKGQQAQA